MFHSNNNLIQFKPLSQVVTQELAYDKGGGYIRCLTLFANIDPASALDETSVKKEKYRRHVSTINQRIPSSIIKSLHWNSEIHEMTEKLFGLQYKYELSYEASHDSLS